MSDSFEEFLFKKLDKYSTHIKEIDKTYVQEGKCADSKNGKPFKPGLCWYNESTALKKLFNFIFGNDWVGAGAGEISYTNLGAILPPDVKSNPKIDLTTLEDFNKSHNFTMGNPVVGEGKKVRQFFNDGNIDEHTIKKLLDFYPAIYGWTNPNTKDSIVSTSYSGDIEKLTSLPNTLNRFAYLEYWTNSECDLVVNEQIKTLDEWIQKNYDVKRHLIKIDNMYSNFNDTSYLITYIVYGKKNNNNPPVGQE